MQYQRVMLNKFGGPAGLCVGTVDELPDRSIASGLQAF
jgi:hypothetical protein